MPDSDISQAPEALLLIATGCPHCQTVLQGLTELVKSGRLRRLEVINVGEQPDRARELGVRSVPWVCIGPFELGGLRTHAELQRWAERAYSQEGMSDYFRELLETGNLGKVGALIQKDPALIDAVMLLLSDPNTGIQVRLGIGAILEELQGTDILQRLIDPLAKLTKHSDARIRSDACHFLAQTHNAGALPVIKELLNDTDREVREVAEESLSLLKKNTVKT